MSDSTDQTLSSPAPTTTGEVLPTLIQTPRDGAPSQSGKPGGPPLASPSRSRYSLIQLHGEGGLGRVYLARDHDLNREVALKEIKCQQVGESEAWVRFVREAQVTGQLEHPSIVPVYELSRWQPDGQPFYTMRFVRGQTLRAAIAEHHRRQRDRAADPLEQPRLLGAFVSICQALGYAHSRGVVHRDLKPENVLLGEFGEVVVLDWGLAKILNETEAVPREVAHVTATGGGQTDATQAGVSMGTPAYMSPEQAEGRLDLLDARTDIYGLGAILFEILTGRPPHQGRNASEVLERIIAGDTPQARKAEPTVPKSLDAICGKAMAKQRDKRYAKAAELAADIQRFLADEPVSACSESWTQRVGRWMRRNRTWTRAGAAALLLITIVSVFATMWVNGARQAADAARLQEEDQRRQADNARQEEAAQRHQAQVAQHNEKLARTKAESLAQESHDRLVRSYEVQGSRLLDEGDLFAAIPWFAAAWKEDQGNVVRDRIHRLRLDAIFFKCPRLVQTLFPEDGVAHAEFSPDDRLILTAAGTLARLWDAETGAPVGPAMAHPGAVTQAVFSPDGRRLVTLSRDVRTDESQLRLWDAATGKPLSRTIIPAGEVSLVAFDPTGDRLLTVSATGGERGEVQIWDAARLQVLPGRIQQAAKIHHACFSHDGKRIVTGAWDGTAQVWDAATTAALLPRALRPRGTVVWFVAFNPDDSRVLTLSGNAAQIWNSRTGVPIGPPLVHSMMVTEAAFSPDGNLVVAGGWDQAGQVWDVASGSRVGLAPRHQGKVSQVLFSRDGRWVLSVGLDQAARLSNSITGAAICPPLKHNAAINHAQFSHNGKRLLTASKDKTVRIWDMTFAHQQIIPPLEALGDGFQAIAISADGRHVLGKSGVLRQAYPAVLAWPPGAAFPGIVPWAALALGNQRSAPQTNSYRLARVWDLTNGKVVSSTLTHPVPIKFGLFSPDGSRVLTVSEPVADKVKFRLWAVQSSTLIGIPFEHPDPVNHVAFSPDGRLLVTAGGRGLSGKGEVRVWDTGAGKLAFPPVEYRTPVFHAVFSPDSLRLATVAPHDPDGPVRVLDVANGRPIFSLTRGSGSVIQASFSPDGGRLVTATLNGEAQVWDLTLGKQIGQALRHDGWVGKAVFSPDGRFVATASLDHTARVWKADTGQAISQPFRHQNGVMDVAFSPDGLLLATASADGTSRIWEVASGLPISPPYEHGGWAYVNRISFTPDGSRVLSEAAATGVGWVYGIPVGPGAIWLTDIKVDKRPAREAALLAEWLAGQHFDATGSVVPLNWENALEHWNALIATLPQQGLLYYRRGRVYAAQGHWQEAIADYTNAIKRGITNVDVWYHRGHAYYSLKRWPEVVADCTKALEGGASDIQVWSERAVAHANLGQFDKAVSDATELIQLEPAFAGGWYGRGASYANLGQWDKAEPDYARAVELGMPPNSWYGHALLRLAVNDWQGYREACARLIRRYEQAPHRDACYWAAWACIVLPDAVTDWVQVRRMADQAWAQSPQTWGYRLLRGAALYRAGRFEEAVKELQEARAAHESDPPAEQQTRPAETHPFDDCAYDLLFLAMSLQRLDRGEEARQTLTKAIHWIKQASRSPLGSGQPSFQWSGRLAHRLLRQEAEALILGSKTASDK